MESQEQNGAHEVEGRGCQSLRSAQACVLSFALLNARTLTHSLTLYCTVQYLSHAFS